MKKIEIDIELFVFVLLILLASAILAGFEINRLQSENADLKSNPIIIYQVDNAGAEMIGKVTDKGIINGHYYVEVGPYGKFLVTREQYEAIKVGDPIPEYLKKRGN